MPALYLQIPRAFWQEAPDRQRERPAARGPRRCRRLPNGEGSGASLCRPVWWALNRPQHCGEELNLPEPPVSGGGPRPALCRDSPRRVLHQLSSAWWVQVLCRILRLAAGGWRLPLRGWSGNTPRYLNPGRGGHFAFMGVSEQHLQWSWVVGRVRATFGRRRALAILPRSASSGGN